MHAIGLLLHSGPSSVIWAHVDQELASWLMALTDEVAGLAASVAMVEDRLDAIELGGDA